MSYFESINWKGIKKDLQKGMDKGMAALKKGAIVAQKKAGDLTDEGKRQYRILWLKTKVHEGMSDLGARVYELMGSRVKNPSLDAQVKNIVAQIHKLNLQIRDVEKESSAVKKKKAA